MSRFEARICKDMPADCCDYGIISFETGKEVCRVWQEEDALYIAALLNAVAPANAIVRDACMEEAARICEALASSILHPNQTITDRCATAIRAAKISTAKAEPVDAHKQVLASLVAAVSILRRADENKVPPNKAVASNKMFRQMLVDYDAAVEAGRKALTINA